jgi:hypothetical protein
MASQSSAIEAAVRYQHSQQRLLHRADPCTAACAARPANAWPCARRSAWEPRYASAGTSHARPRRVVHQALANVRGGAGGPHTIPRRHEAQQAAHPPRSPPGGGDSTTATRRRRLPNPPPPAGYRRPRRRMDHAEDLLRAQPRGGSTNSPPRRSRQFVRDTEGDDGRIVRSRLAAKSMRRGPYESCTGAASAPDGRGRAGLGAPVRRAHARNGSATWLRLVSARSSRLAPRPFRERHRHGGRAGAWEAPPRTQPHVRGGGGVNDGAFGSVRECAFQRRSATLVRSSPRRRSPSRRSR